MACSGCDGKLLMSDVATQLAAATAASDGLLAWFKSGYGVIFVAAISFFSTVVAAWPIEWAKTFFSKKVENHKLDLRKLELIFQKRFEAAGEFLKLKREIIPPQSPGFDIDDAIPAICYSFPSSIEKIREYEQKYSFFLTDEIRGFVREAIGISLDHADEAIASHQHEEGYDIAPSDAAENGAKRLMINLESIEQLWFAEFKISK